jgi:glucose/mannose-6-phosphate isomerase
MNNEYEEAYNSLKKEVFNSGKSFMGAYNKINDVISNSVKNLLICGMGGSGISANYIHSLNNSPSVSVTINKDYSISRIPQDVLVIVISYSGNTEETIQMYNQLVSDGVKPIVITSGGKLSKLADKNSNKRYDLPKNLQPRAAFPHILGTLYGLTKDILKLTKIDEKLEDQISRSSNFENDKNLISKLGKISKSLQRDLPFILSASQLSPVGLRFRCQLNENSKIPAINLDLPEFSHNAIVALDGFFKEKHNFFLIPSKFQNHRTNIHFDFIRNLKGLNHEVLELVVNSESILEEILTLTWYTDFISIQIAELQKIDPIAVPSIVQLKEILSKNK